jgi:hypothetical protein
VVRPRLRSAGIRDQQPNRTKTSADFCDRGAEGVLVTCIGLEELAAAALIDDQAPSLAGCSIVASVVQRDGRTAGRKPQTAGPPNAASASGDERHVFLKLGWVHR